MPRPHMPSHREIAAQLLGAAAEADDDRGPAVLRQEALIHAMLAVAEELDQARQAVIDVSEALKNQDGHGAGTSLYYIADYVKDIAERIR